MTQQDKPQTAARQRRPIYRGRFAPSPTGPLHFGSLIAAVGSYLQARSQGGQWLVRIEDIDPPREIPGAADDILRTLERYGFEWDETVRYQSRRHALYEQALESLQSQGQLYPCACSRKSIASVNQTAGTEAVYPGTCRHGLPPGKPPRSLRILTHNQHIQFEDRVQGPCAYNLEKSVGDFVLRRADGMFSYQLAVAIDDVEQGITEVMRGSDLLDSTPRQLHIQQQLGLDSPEYAHLPIVTNRQGEKLSKQTRAQALSQSKPLAPLLRALQFLNQHPPATLEAGSLTDLWQWAMQHWQPDAIPRRRAIVDASEDKPANLNRTRASDAGTDTPA